MPFDHKRQHSKALQWQVDQDNDGTADYRPLRRVWAAVMHRGVIDYCDQRNGRVIDSDDSDIIVRTFEWFHSDENSGPGSFIWLCELLDYDPQYVRRRVDGNWKHISDKGQKGGRRAGGH